jgi:polyketide synthase PksN
MDVDTPSPGDPRALWMQWTVAVARALQGMFRNATTAPLLPYRARRVSWAELPTAGPQRLLLSADADSGRLGVRGEIDGRTVLQIDGLELREARWLVQSAPAEAEVLS